ncbi:MAG: 30S ribosomal protein S8 [Opitutales bacterium]
MAVHDTIGDFLTILRNGSLARKESCETYFSKIREGIAAILKDEGYIKDYAVKTDDKGRKSIVVHLKYVQDAPALTGISRVSKPGRRIYCGYRDIPRVLGGLGIAILTTSKGIMRAREARRNKLGGELICNVW